MPGGAADTVRSWVLALAAAAADDEAPAGQTTYTERFTVVETADDGPEEARCSLVRDENGTRFVTFRPEGD